VDKKSRVGRRDPAACGQKHDDAHRLDVPGIIVAARPQFAITPQSWSC
jgi:hypothetical protein